MRKSSRFSATSCSPAERGGIAVLGCSPFGSQRAISAPRSNAAGLGRGSQEAIAVRQGFEGRHGLFVTFGAASGLSLPPPRKPNPALKRTAHGKPWSAA
jgi:hypothetical protein